MNESTIPWRTTEPNPRFARRVAEAVADVDSRINIKFEAMTKGAASEPNQLVGARS